MRRPVLITAAIALVCLGVWMRQPHAAGPIANAQSRRPGLVVVGDSLAAGFGLNPGEAYPDLLPGLLGLPPEGVVNLGVPGMTLADARAHIGQALSRPEGAVLILLGGNDQLQRRSAEEAMADLTAAVEALQSHGKMVIVADFSPMGIAQSAWSRGYAAVARDHGCLLVPGVCDGLYTGGPEYLQSDRIHLTALGQRVAAARLARALGPQWNVDPAELNQRIAALGVTE
jgi:acyl-CoA thioesterase I